MIRTLTVFLLLTCTGCTRSNESPPNYKFGRIAVSGPVFILIDRKTGCEYVGTHSGGITPRLGPDAIPNCNGTITRLNDVEM